MNSYDIYMEEYQGPLITFVSASGGVGKSTLALLCAFLSARSGMHTNLVEADLQFGDFGFWLGLDEELPSLAQGSDCSAIKLCGNLDLYKAPPLPEVAEQVSDELAHFIPELRANAELTIADTGQFWSGLTADLVCNSDIVVHVMDQRLTSAYGAIKESELCTRLGVPSARSVYVRNRRSGKPNIEIDELCTRLGTDEIFEVADGRKNLSRLVESGEIERLLDSGNPAIGDLNSLLAGVLPRVGRLYADAPVKKRGMVFA